MTSRSDDIRTSEIDPWLTVAEFAEAMRVQPVTVRSWITKGELAATRSGRRKWLIRRSEIDRMLGTEAATAPAVPRRPEPEQPSTHAHVTPRFPPPSGTRESVRTLLGSAVDNMTAALVASSYAPPSYGYVDRLRAIADGFEHFAATSIHAGNTAGATWKGRDDWTLESLPYEVRPGGNRPRRHGLWDGFDEAFGQVCVAMAGHDIIALGHTFRAASDELLAVADQLSGDDARDAGFNAS